MVAEENIIILFVLGDSKSHRDLKLNKNKLSKQNKTRKTRRKFDFEKLLGPSFP